MDNENMDTNPDRPTKPLAEPSGSVMDNYTTMVCVGFSVSEAAEDQWAAVPRKIRVSQNEQVSGRAQQNINNSKH